MILLLSLFLSATSAIHDVAGLPPTRVVNGTAADPGQFPFQVSLQFGESHACGATILNELWMLTAAHCFDHVVGVNLLSVLAGTNLLDDVTAVRRKVSQVIVHPQYDPDDAYANDIAVFRVDRPLTWNSRIQPVSLPSEGEDTMAGTIVTLIGWGSQYDGGPAMDALQMVDLVVFSDEECAEAHEDITHDTNICAGIPQGGKGQCSGDSGGPLLRGDTQIGIVSWSVKPCASPGYAGVFTEVSKYVNWINKSTRSP